MNKLNESGSIEVTSAARRHGCIGSFRLTCHAKAVDERYFLDSKIALLLAPNFPQGVTGGLVRLPLTR